MRQFKAEGLRDDLFAGTPDALFIKYLLAKAASCKDFGILVIDISVAFMHARTDEEIYVKVPSGIKSSKNWKLKAAVHGTRKASKHWQAGDKYAFQQNDINPCIYTRFCDDLDLEQHCDDFLVCGVTRSLEKLTEEFNRNFLVFDTAGTLALKCCSGPLRVILLLDTKRGRLVMRHLHDAHLRRHGACGWRTHLSRAIFLCPFAPMLAQWSAS